MWPSIWAGRNPGPCGLGEKSIFSLNVFFLSLKDIFSRGCLKSSVSGDQLSFFLREEDEYSELRSELSQSQHEVNEDSRSMDQDQTSVSIPENQSTMVTADMGESACRYHQPRVWFLDCNRNFRNVRQPELKFNFSRSLLSGWSHMYFSPLHITLLVKMELKLSALIHLWFKRKSLLFENSGSREAV